MLLQRWLQVGELARTYTCRRSMLWFGRVVKSFVRRLKSF